MEDKEAKDIALLIMKSAVTFDPTRSNEGPEG